MGGCASVSSRGHLTPGGKLVTIQINSPPPLRDVAWKQLVDIPACYLRKPTSIPETERRAISLPQLGDLGNFIQHVLAKMKIMDPNPDSNVGRITWANINLYHINELFVMPLSFDGHCSFVELIAERPQDPRWFISHWWGTPFRDTLGMISFHIKTRDVDATAPYWMCTFANNQHDLEELNQPHLAETPFVRAILSNTCVGTVMLMNINAEPFRRSWCILEKFVSTSPTYGRRKTPAHLLDIAAIIPEKSQFFTVRGSLKTIPRSHALLLDDGFGNLTDRVEIVGATFPDEVARQGVTVDIETAKASRVLDKQNILRLIIDDPDPSAIPPISHPEYDRVNAAIHRIFASRALYRAAQLGDSTETNRLLDARLVSPDCTNCLGMGPLYAAAFFNHVSVVNQLLLARANVEQSTGDGATALFAAVGRNSLETLKLLLEHRANPNTQMHGCTCAALIASQEGHADSLKLLLAAQADPSIPRIDGWTPVRAAAKKNHVNVLQMLLEAGTSFSEATSDGRTALSDAVEANSVDAVQILLRARGDPNSTLQDGTTVLHIAAGAGNKFLCEMLIDASAGLNLSTRDGTTALILSAHFGHMAVCELLLGRNAQRDAIAQGAVAALDKSGAPIVRSLRPAKHGNGTSLWLTVGAVSLAQSVGRYYYELQLGCDVFNPQIGWATEEFEMGKTGSGQGVGDDCHSWAVDGMRHVKWHAGEREIATWPESWTVGGIVGCAIDICLGQMSFAYNGAWLPAANFNFQACNKNFYPAVTMKGDFTFHFAAHDLCYSAPDDSFKLLMTPDDDKVQGTGSCSRPKPVHGNVLEVARMAGHEELTQLLTQDAFSELGQ